MHGYKDSYKVTGIVEKLQAHATENKTSSTVVGAK